MKLDSIPVMGLLHSIKRSIIISVLIILVSACNMVKVGDIDGPVGFSGKKSTPVDRPKYQPNSTLSPSITPEPTSTLIPTITSTGTPTLHPMNILAARQTTYPGSLITIEETLKPGANYNRYIAWYTSDGLKIYGLLTIPHGEMPASGWPAIVVNHGYIPPEVYRTTERYVAYVDLLARNGYIVYKIDYRGHDQSEGEPDRAYGNPGYTVDVLNAVGALKAYPQVDAQRSGLWGHSMGGFLTLRAMTISKDIKAGVIWAGVVGSYPDLLCWWRQPKPGVPTPTPNPNFRSG